MLEETKSTQGFCFCCTTYRRFNEGYKKSTTAGGRDMRAKRTPNRLEAGRAPVANFSEAHNIRVLYALE